MAPPSFLSEPPATPLSRWERALDLALQYKQHVDTVLWYRKQYLEAANGEELVQRFKDLTDEVSWRCTEGACRVCMDASGAGRAENGWGGAGRRRLRAERVCAPARDSVLLLTDVPLLLCHSQTPLDEKAIKANIEQEKITESQRPGARRYV